MGEKETCPKCGKYGYSFLHSCPGIPQKRWLEDLERGRQLASERDDLIAQGVDPNDLLIPLAPVLCACPETGAELDADTERVLRVLTAHAYTAPKGRGAERGYYCKCGEGTPPDEQGQYSANHRIHVATALTNPPARSTESAPSGLSEAEREALSEALAEHQYVRPAFIREADGVEWHRGVSVCSCGATYTRTLFDHVAQVLMESGYRIPCSHCPPGVHVDYRGDTVRHIGCSRTDCTPPARSAESAPSGLTFEESEAIGAVLIAHGMDEPHDGHDEWDCRDAVRAVVERIMADRLAAQVPARDDAATAWDVCEGECCAPRAASVETETTGGDRG